MNKKQNGGERKRDGKRKINGTSFILNTFSACNLKDKKGKCSGSRTWMNEYNIE